MTTRPAYLVPHTHWDREWYRTFQQFRLDLVRVVDGVLDTLDGDPAFAHFMLDGQTIVLDDYLAMRPGRAGQLRRLIESGRLSVGPWYCHPDLFLVSGESLVRNLMLGLRMARAYGGAMMVGYVPDQFGHTGQLPQILRGFGIESAVLWRGVDARATRNEGAWEAPDGSAVFLEHLAGFWGYGNAQRLPLEPAALAAHLRRLCAELREGATGPGVLLMNGSDHLPIQAGLPAALATANRLLEGEWRVEITSLREAVDRLRAEGRPAGVLRGELRSSATAHLLPGVLSARIPQIKRRNADAQTLLEREVEPYAAWASLLGAAYPHGELWEAWRHLLRNQPHDSVCGCSIDQVHREMGTRYDAVEQIGEALLARALGHLVAHIDTRPPGPGGASATDAGTEAPIPIVIFNGGDGARTERVRLTLQLPGVAGAYELVDEREDKVAHAWTDAGGEPTLVTLVPREMIPPPDAIMAQIDGNRLMGLGLQRLAMRVEEDGLHVEATVGESGIVPREDIEAHVHAVHRLLAETGDAPVTLHVHHNARHELRVLARDVPAHGYRTLWLRPRAADDEPGDAGDDAAAEGAGDPHAIESDLFRVSADAATGALTVTDHRTGVSYGPCNLFVDGGDAGDGYTYAPPAADTVVDRPAARPAITAARDPLGATLTIRQELVVPRRLAEGRAARSAETTTLAIESVVTLTHGCPRVDIATTVANTAEDHRLRVTFDLPLSAGHVHAGQAFDVVRRPVGIAPAELALAAPREDPVPEAPQQGFVLAHDGGRGLLIAGAGLPEYAAAPSEDGSGTRLSLTLLRCVGWLSRDDLPTRRGGAGPSLETPEAQCPGTHTFQYSLIPLAGDWRPMIAEAHHAALPLRALTADPAGGDLPSTASFLALDELAAAGVAVSAIKGAEDGRGLVVRLYNGTDEPARGRLRLLHPVAEVERLSLDERALATLHAGDEEPSTEVALELGPHKIETLRLVPADARRVRDAREAYLWRQAADDPEYQADVRALDALFAEDDARAWEG